MEGGLGEASFHSVRNMGCSLSWHSRADGFSGVRFNPGASPLATRLSPVPGLTPKPPISLNFRTYNPSHLTFFRGGFLPFRLKRRAVLLKTFPRGRFSRNPFQPGAALLRRFTVRLSSRRSPGLSDCRPFRANPKTRIPLNFRTYNPSHLTFLKPLFGRGFGGGFLPFRPKHGMLSFLAFPRGRFFWCSFQPRGFTPGYQIVARTGLNPKTTYSIKFQNLQSFAPHIFKAPLWKGVWVGLPSLPSETKSCSFENISSRTVFPEPVSTRGYTPSSFHRSTELTPKSRAIRLSPLQG